MVVLVPALLGGAWIGMPSSVQAGFSCDPGFDCGELKFVTPGNGNGTITADGINCTIDGGVKSGDCSEVYQWQTPTKTVAVTLTAAKYSYFQNSLGTNIPAGQPFVEYVLLSGNAGETFKEAWFKLGQQELALEVKGAGSGVIHHSDVGVVCPTDCTLRADYGTGVILVADPAPGSVFKGWSGPCASQDASCEIDMPESGRMSATFGLKSTATPSPRPATAAPTVAPATPSAPTETPAASAGPSSVPSAVASAAASPSGAAPSSVGSPDATQAPTSPTAAGGDLGPIILIGVVLLVVSAGGAFLLVTRRRTG